MRFGGSALLAGWLVKRDVLQPDRTTFDMAENTWRARSNDFRKCQIEMIIRSTCSSVSTVYFVSVNGDDGNDGLSPKTAFATFDAAMKAATLRPFQQRLRPFQPKLEKGIYRLPASIALI